MKISNYMYSGSVYPESVKAYGRNNIKQKPYTASGFSQALDSVEISSDAMKVRYVGDSDVRMDKVISVQEQIKSGRYEINPQTVARNILSGSSLY